MSDTFTVAGITAPLMLAGAALFVYVVTGWLDRRGRKAPK